MNSNTRVNRYSKSITLGEHRKLQEEAQDNYFVLVSAEDDDFLVINSHVNYTRLYLDDLEF